MLPQKISQQNNKTRRARKTHDIHTRTHARTKSTLQARTTTAPHERQPKTGPERKALRISAEPGVARSLAWKSVIRERLCGNLSRESATPVEQLRKVCFGAFPLWRAHAGMRFRSRLGASTWGPSAGGCWVHKRGGVGKRWTWKRGDGNVTVMRDSWK